ncbi:MAG: TylF/MycF family methyltransferase [Burkholderiales bacterium]
MTQSAKELYLDLLKRCLTNIIYRDPSMLREKTLPFDMRNRGEGRDWPLYAHTMIGIRRLDALHYCVEDVLDRNVPGDFIETGVWRGGAVIFMRGVLKARAVGNRVVWAADSFEGMPKPDVGRYPLDAAYEFQGYKELAVSLEQVQENFRRYGLLDDQVRFLKGWFRDTLPTAPIGRLALLRLDGDLYESTLDALTYLFPKLARGGYVIVDDYSDIPACKQAVSDYRDAHGIGDEIIPIDWSGAFWRKESGPGA